MRSNPAVIEALNGILTAERIGINLYLAHAKMCAKAQLGLIQIVGTDRYRVEELEE